MTRIFGLMMVRNEEDILAVNLRHHLAQGISRFLVVDNGSSDGTQEILERFAAEGCLEWRADAGPYLQGEITTRLAHEAYLQGADWVLPLDADELWCSTSDDLSLVDVLDGVPAQTAALEVQVHNFIQRRDQLQPTTEGLAQLTRRCPAPAGPVDAIFAQVERREIAYVEAVYPTKWLCRASLLLRIGMGNHRVRGLAGERAATSEVTCLHAPLRARSVLEAKARDHGPRADDLGIARDIWWQVRRWRQLAEAGELEAEWRANSFDPGSDAGELDVFGTPHATVVDTRWRDSVLPWLDVSDGTKENATREPPAASDDADPLEARLARQQEGIEALQRELERRDRLSADRLGEKQQAIDWLREQLDARQRLLDDKQRQLDDKQRAIDWLNEQIHDRDRQILDRDGEILRRDDRLAELQGALDEIHAEIFARDARIERRDEELLRRDRALDEKQAAIDWLRQQLREKERSLLARGRSALTSMLAKRR